MRHIGISGKFALITAVAALGMLVLTAITLEEAVTVTFLGLAAVAYVAAVAELLGRRRHLALLATGVGSSLTNAFFLAFLSTWELGFADQSTIVGTPLPTDDPDNYFFWAAASAVATVLVLSLGVVWPSGKRLAAGGRLVAGGHKPSPASRRPATRGAAARKPAGRGAATRSAAATGSAAQHGTSSGSTAQRASGSRAPARLPAAARVPAVGAKPPSSSAAPVRKTAPKPAPKSGAKTASRR
ncbi:hypothetical protein ABIB45_002969 [Arthrobacter sp. UYCo732]